MLNIEAVNTLDLYDAATGARERIARENDYKQRVIINLITVSPDDSLVAGVHATPNTGLVPRRRRP